MEINYPLTEKQEKLKKNWLNLTIFRQCWFFLNICISPFIFPLDATLDQDKYLIEVVTTAIVSLLCIVVLYINAYKQPGVKLLTIVLCLSLGQLGNLGHLLFADVPIPLSLMIFIILDAGFFIWWWRLTFKVRRLNHLIQSTSLAPRI